MDASKIIDEKLASIEGWRGEKMRAIRRLILAVDPEIVEEWKWMGTPVWNRHGILCVANAHSKVVKVTFMYGAKLKDPKRLFNAGLEGNARRAIDYTEDDEIDGEGLKGLIRAAIAYNAAKPAARTASRGDASVTAKKSGAKKAAAKKAAAKKPAATTTSAAAKRAPATKKKAAKK
jgi:hypothetical protein